MLHIRFRYRDQFLRNYDMKNKFKKFYPQKSQDGVEEETTSR